MALTPNDNQAFIREVDDEYRRERLTEFWTRWGKLLVAALLLGLIAFGGYLYWQHHQRQLAGEQGEQMQAAFDQLASGQVAKAQPMIATLAGSDRDGYRALAKFTQADIALQKDDLRTAAARFAEVAKDESLAKPFRDLALIRQTSAEFDSLRPQVVVERMRPLAVPGSPWLGSAGELMAMAQIRLGQGKEAGAVFGRIARDEDTPPSLRQRAVQMAGVLGVDAVAPNEEARAR